MPRDITVTFADGSQHVYKGAPDDATPEQVTERARKEFGREVTALDGGRKAQTTFDGQTVDFDVPADATEAQIQQMSIDAIRKQNPNAQLPAAAQVGVTQAPTVGAAMGLGDYMRGQLGVPQPESAWQSPKDVSSGLQGGAFGALDFLSTPGRLLNQGINAGLSAFTGMDVPGVGDVKSGAEMVNALNPGYRERLAAPLATELAGSLVVPFGPKMVRTSPSFGYNAVARAEQAAAKPALSAANKQVADDSAREGITVNRAMVDPKAGNRVTGVDASMAGGPRLQRGMREIEGQIESRVGALGQGGTAMNAVDAGLTIKDAAQRTIKETGERAGRMYDRAEKIAGDAKIAAKQSLAAIDQQLARLGETPGTNATEIAYLNTLKSDLSKDLSVGALRRLRTTLRKKISKGDLVFGEDEARVLGIMDSAADDIAEGLTQQGKGEAAQLFKQADTAYRDRMGYITGTLQKIVGKRSSNLSAEQIAGNLSGMAKGRDTLGVKRFLDNLTPEELADVRATFAESLGTNAKDGFTVTQFLRQTSKKNFPPNALRVVFGKEGAESIARLRNVGERVERVTAAMNSRKSGTGVANDYQSWLYNTLIGVGLGGAGGQSLASAIVGGTAALGAKAGRDILSARALLSPEISKWIESAPRTTSPSAINAHLEKLTTMGAKSSAYQMDIQGIKQYLEGAIRQSPGSAAAQDETN